MTTVIVTGVTALHAGISYHRRLRRYMVELTGEGISVEVVLTTDQVAGLLSEFRQQEHKVQEVREPVGARAQEEPQP